MTRTILALLFAFAAAAEPHIATIKPASGIAGTYIHILGSDLTPHPPLCSAIDCFNYVKVGDTYLDAVAFDMNDWVVAAPPHAPGAVDVVINVAGRAKITIPNGFRYDDPTADDVERVMIPINVNAHGAFGSAWLTDITMHNATDATVLPQAPTCNPLILAPCLQFRIEPHQTVHPTLYNVSGTQGAIIRLPRAVADRIDIQARVVDLSRAAQTWGTDLPVVRETDFRRVVRLHAVPTDARFRATLRIYGYLDAVTAQLRILDEATHAVIGSQKIALAASQDSTSYPPYAQISSLRDTFPQIAAYETVGVEVESELIWAFVSVTNNETQHVTVIAPQ